MLYKYNQSGVDHHFRVSPQGNAEKILDVIPAFAPFDYSSG